ncbi:hypothetical protein EDD21DRAFT_83732, partial [Dissophora ornata]
TLESATNIQSAVSDSVVDSNISSNSSKAQVQVKSPAPSSQKNSEQEHPGSTLVTESCQKSTDSLLSSTPVSDPTAEVASWVQDDEDVTSPHREFLRAKIEGIKKILVDLNPPSCLSVRPELPSDLSTVDEDIYVAWCTSTDEISFRKKMFSLIERLQSEEQERKRLRNMDRRIYGVKDDSPHRKYLRVKIEDAKLLSFEIISLGLSGKSLPDKPLLREDVDFYKAVCHCSGGLRGTHVPYGCAEDIGFLIADLVAREKEEREYLLQRKKNRN